MTLRLTAAQAMVRWLSQQKNEAGERFIEGVWAIFGHGNVAGLGEALHGMWIRLTIDAEMVIQSCEAATDSSPYAICPDITPNFARLAGVRIGPGFNRAVKERVGGTEGCTHLRELLAQMATVAYQTLHSVRTRRRRDNGEGEPPLSPGIVGTCHAYAPDSPVVRRRKG